MKIGETIIMYTLHTFENKHPKSYISCAFVSVTWCWYYVSVTTMYK